MTKFEDIKNIILENSKELNEEFKRVFHGRGNFYEGWKFLTVDSIDKILSIAFYYEIEHQTEEEILEFFKQFILSSRHEAIILQRRYLKNSPTEIIEGKIPKENFALENSLKYKLNLLSNQNSGYFPDMKKGREYIKSISKDKNVLNLFSYTCGFSLAAAAGGAKSVTNVDMSKSALTAGRENHRINGIGTENINFMPYNILKSFSRIKKKGPYDIIIIDPPTFQSGSFAATKDYAKIIKRLDQLSAENCTVLSCLNSPDLDSSFIIDLFKEFAPGFEYEKRLVNLDEFKAADERRSLKNLIFIKKRVK
jgi:23S rRNA (cytosine1962-C5)-methyltransferase